MARVYWKPSNLLNPVPAVLISCTDGEGNDNVMTAAWAGTVCSDPVMVSVSIRKSRHSHAMIMKTREFVMNLTSEEMVRAVDYAGIYSGAKVDKFDLPGQLHMTKERAHVVNAPCVAESPLCLECKVTQVLELGSHDMFIAEITAVDIDKTLIDEKGKLHIEKAGLMTYAHGTYFALGKKIGSFGFSVKPKRTKQSGNKGKRKK